MLTGARGQHKVLPRLWWDEVPGGRATQPKEQTVARLEQARHIVDVALGRPKHPHSLRRSSYDTQWRDVAKCQGGHPRVEGHGIVAHEHTVLLSPEASRLKVMLDPAVEARWTNKVISAPGKAKSGFGRNCR